jgi:hypothetical protein
MEKIFCSYIKSITFAEQNRGVAQLASALAWGARGRKFESSHPDQAKPQLLTRQVIAVFFIACGIKSGTKRISAKCWGFGACFFLFASTKFIIITCSIDKPQINRR